MSHWDEFQLVIVNDDFDTAVNDLAEIIGGNSEAYLSQREALKPLLKSLVDDPAGAS